MSGTNEEQVEKRRAFMLRIQPQRNTETEIVRPVVLSADLGVFEKLYRDPERPIDLLSDKAAIELVATDVFTQGALIYAMSDAQDIDERTFMRGLASNSFAEALLALRGALVDFFLAIGRPDSAQTVTTAFETMVQGRAAMAANVRSANISEQIVAVLRSEDVQAAVDFAIADGLKDFQSGLRPGV